MRRPTQMEKTDATQLWLVAAAATGRPEHERLILGAMSVWFVLEAQLSVRDLERLSGVSTALIAKLEAGDRPDPSFRTVSRLASAIDISLDEVVRRASGAPSANSTASSVATAAKALAELDRAAKSANATQAAIAAAREALLSPAARARRPRPKPSKQ